MKDIKLQDRTHKKLSILKAALAHGSFDETVNYLIDKEEDE